MKFIFTPFFVFAALFSTMVVFAQPYPDASKKGGIVVVIVGGRSTNIPTTGDELVQLELHSPSGIQLATVSLASSSTWQYTGSLAEQGTYLLLVSKPSGNCRYLISIE